MNRLMLVRVVIAAAFYLLWTPALATAAGEWAGTFAGDKLTVTLRPDAADGNEYAGTITLGDRVMPAKGRFDPAKGFAGTFEAGGAQFAFSLADGPGGTVVLSSDTKRYELRKQAALPGGGGAGKLPEFLRPGLRISYSAGSSVVAGVSSKLVPAPGEEGKYVDPKTGKTYDDDPTHNSGGVGIVQIDILQADEKLIVADVRNYLMVDLQKKLVTLSNAAGITGTGGGLGDYWINPAALAGLREGQNEQGKVSRLRYTAGGRRFDAVGIQRDLASGYSHRIYDLATGLMLSNSDANPGEDVTTIDPATGKTGKGKGSTVISHARFLGTRQVNLPWANEPPPQWAGGKGQRLELAGGYAAVLATGPLPQLPMSVSFVVEQSAGAAVITTMTTKQGIGNNLPVQESSVPRCFSSAGRGCLWLSPRIAQQLKANTIIDEDPVIQYRTTFAGVQNGMAVLVDQGPLESTQFGYDMRTGMLAWMRISRDSATGRIETQLQAR